VSEDIKALVLQLEIQAATYGTFRQSSLTSRLLDRASDTIRELERQLDALQSDGWLLITAIRPPRDGTKFLACIQGIGQVRLVSWDDPNDRLPTGPDNAVWHCLPTHWRPLPTPPSAGESK
jgi:hypothetical protein